MKKSFEMLIAVSVGILQILSLYTGSLFAVAKKPQITPYGFVLVNVLFNTDNPIPVDIPVTAKENPDGTQSFLITARQTRFGLKMTGTEALGAKVGGGIELDFFGLTGSSSQGGVTQSAPRLRRAFLTLDWKNTRLLAGQEWVVFAPLSPTSLAHVSIPEFSGSGNLWNRIPQITVEYRMKTGEKGEVKGAISMLRPFGADIEPFFLVSQSEVAGSGEKKGLPFVQGRVGVSVKPAQDKAVTVGGSFHVGSEEGVAGNDLGTFAVTGDVGVKVCGFGLSGGGVAGKNTTMLFSQAGVVDRGEPTEHEVNTSGGWGQVSYTHKRVGVNAGYGI